MRVLINGLSAVKFRTGVGHTTVNLHRALVERHPEDAFWLAPGQWIADAASRVVRGPLNNVRYGTQGAGRKVRTLVSSAVKSSARTMFRSHLQLAAKWGGFEIYHEPNFVAVPTALPTVVTVHDLSVVLHPEWHPADRVQFHERHFHKSLKEAAHVIVVSESVRQEVIAILGLPPERVSAVYNGIDSRFTPQSRTTVETLRQRKELPEKYLLAIGTIEPRKNIGTLMRAFCDLPAEMRESCPLVLAGGWGWKSQADRDYYENEARFRGVMHLGYVQDSDLAALYSGASALFYPSHYEGFGLPPVEMLACGGAVVASTATALREVLGSAVYFVEPGDQAGWRDAMHRVMRDEGFVADLRRGGIERASEFTWRRSAEQTHAVYRQILGVEHSPHSALSIHAA